MAAGAMNGERSAELRRITKVFTAAAHARRSVYDVDLGVGRSRLVTVYACTPDAPRTLLDLVWGSVTPDAGSVEVLGRDLRTMSQADLDRLHRRSVVLLDRPEDLSTGMSALDNVAAPLLIDGFSPGEADAAGLDALEFVGIGHVADALPWELDFGTLWLTVLARAIAPRPQVLLVEDPTAGCDPLEANDLLRLLVRTAHERAVAVMLATTQPRVAAYGDVIYPLVDGRLSSAGVVGAADEG